MNDAENIVELIPRLRRYARALAGDRAAADDLVQDTLERAWSKFHLYRRGTDLRAWLFTVMHNVFVNQRALARHEKMHVSLDAEADGGEAWQIPVRSMQYTRVELLELMQHVGRLPVDQRQVLLLAVVEELRYEEIASTLAIPIGTVMSRLSRAREKLRAAFADKPGSPSSLKIVK